MRKERHIQRRETLAFWPVRNAETGEIVGVVANLTEEGIQLHSKQEFQMGEVLTIQIVLDTALIGTDHITLFITNTWCKESEVEAFYHAGFHITKLSDRARISIRDLLKAFSYPAPHSE